MSDRYLVVSKWEKFQHYKDRNPPWIKNYTELLSDDAYLGLSGHRRSILHGVWLEYARSHCRLPHDTRILTRRLNLKVTTADLTALVDAGFIDTSASTPPAPRATSASPRARPRARTEAEAEKEPPHTPPQTRGDNGDYITKKELRRYTGCRQTRGTHGYGWKRDPLGTDRPPPDWPYDKPTPEEVLTARAAQT